MFSPSTVLITIIAYVAVLFLAAYWVERGSALGRRIAESPVVYSLALGVYCTTWTFYGSVGNCATGGIAFLGVYLGPTLCLVFWWILLRKLVRIKSKYRITSIADFISARYGKSHGIAALATLLALVGSTPYIALQLKAVGDTFSILTATATTSSSWIQGNVGPIFVALMVTFTILFGARRLDPTERHEGIMLALAIECVVKLIAFLAAGIFVTYVLFDGPGDVFAKIGETKVINLLFSENNDVNSYLRWMSILILGASAILFLPRQFHIAVVENADENHIRTAVWLFPLYMFLINLFVVPIAAGGLIMGYPVSQADTFVLTLPLKHGTPLLALFVFIGGMSAAMGMVIVSTMANATMVANHLFLPVITKIPALAPLKKHLLKARWLAICLILIMGHFFAFYIGNSYTLVNMGLISFVAVLQFAPPIIGGLFWHRGNKTGAMLGLGAGALTWLYTMLIPSFAKSGWISADLLAHGPWGLSFLRPEHLFGSVGVPGLVHAVFWTLFVNIGLYVAGSLLFEQPEEERRIAGDFIDILGKGRETLLSLPQHSLVNWTEKRAILEGMLNQFLPSGEVDSLIEKAIRSARIKLPGRISIVELAEVANETEHYLSGFIGTASAHQTIRRAKLFTDVEEGELKDLYGEILANLKISPNELIKKIDYYQGKEELLTRYSKELIEQVAERTRDLQAAAEVIHVATSISVLDDLILRVVTLINERFKLSYVGLFLVEDGGDGNAMLTAGSGDPCSEMLPEDGRIRVGEGALGRCLSGGGHVIKRDPLDQPAEVINSNPFCYCTEIALPLKIADSVIGVLYLQCPKPEIFAGEGALAVFQTLSDQVAIAISNTRMYEKIKMELLERKRAEDALELAYSELKQTQSQLLQREKMASIGQLAAGVAHEINNPMGFISSNIRSLGKYAGKMVDFFTQQDGVIKGLESNDQIRKLAELRKQLKIDYILDDFNQIIEESLEGAERVQAIINNLKNFSRIDSVGKSGVNLNDCIESTLNMVWNEIKYKATVEKDYGDLPQITCFPQQLNQVFMNLLVNASQAIESQGVITIRTWAGEGGVRVSIADTGDGIESDKLGRIFEPFFTTKEVGKGTGLGLSISYDIVKKHRGEIAVQSEPGKGTVFTISLPTA